MSGQTSSTQGNQKPWIHGRTYKSESWSSLSSQPQVASRGYTQNHAHYQQHLKAWTRKTRPIAGGDVRDVVPVKVIMGVVCPGQKNITCIGVSVTRVQWLDSCMLTLVTYPL